MRNPPPFVGIDVFGGGHRLADECFVSVGEKPLVERHVGPLDHGLGPHGLDHGGPLDHLGRVPGHLELEFLPGHYPDAGPRGIVPRQRPGAMWTPPPSNAVVPVVSVPLARADPPPPSRDGLVVLERADDVPERQRTCGAAVRVSDDQRGGAGRLPGQRSADREVLPSGCRS